MLFFGVPLLSSGAYLPLCDAFVVSYSVIHLEKRFQLTHLLRFLMYAGLKILETS
ncbi:hypothetical protein KC19_8G116700 [Ceratodon purpureus]|uniref:Uncharacterized protein n=1 Tax=Ceratodon purpureus TaxID=3225 RepID=A0A8T0H1B2_CERPU|nr:hypothetical protein KC19_8G116700 [Ceratodon purpureus]